jgi:hypothetical protein
MAATGRAREELVMQRNGNRAEAKVQAISWLVSQLRWERTLGALRHDPNADARGVTRQAA